jgi:hypothetical protein
MMGMKSCFFKSIVLIIPVYIIFHGEAFSQQGCSQNLETARNQFVQGNYYEIRNTLQACLNSGFSRVERIEALELLALTEMYLDHSDLADSSYLALLRIDPEHTVDETADPPDLVFLHRSFKTKPLFIWNINAGFNQVYPRNIYQYSIFPRYVGGDDSLTRALNVDEDFQTRTGYNIGGGIEFILLKNLFVGIDGQLVFGTFNAKYRTGGLDTKGNNSNLITSVIIPVYARYQFGNKRLKPYLTTGGILNMMVNSNLNSSRENFLFTPISSDKLNLTNLFERINYSVMFGGGLVFKTSGISSLALDVSYRLGFKNYAIESKRFSLEENQRSLINLGYIPPAARLDQFMISLKYLRPLYNPKKILPK